MRIILILILLAAIVAASFAAYTKYNNPNISTIEKVNEVKVYNSSTTDFDLEIQGIQSISAEPKDINTLNYYGWIPDWDMVDGLNTLKNNPQIKTVFPFWFDLKEDGSLKLNAYTNWGQLLDYAFSNDVNLVPTITSFDKEILTKVLNSTDNSARFLDQVVTYAKENEYYGIDIDFESFYITDQKAFLDLMFELKKRLSQENKKLFISALPKWGNHINYGQSKATLNYKALGEIFDVFIIQGYAYTTNYSNAVSPVGPIDWQKDVIRYAIKEGIPRDKIVLGTNTYALDWSDRALQRELLYYTAAGLPDVDQSQEAGVAYYHNGIDRLYSNYSVEEEFLDNWGEMLGTYNFNGQIRRVVFPNSKSIELRKQLASEYGINGISFWRLGDEGSLKLF
jgi:spore germination protein YaaH